MTFFNGVNSQPSAKYDFSTNRHDDGARVYRGAEGKYEEAKTLLTDLQGLKKQIGNDPNLSDVRKRVLIRDIDKGIEAAKKALDFTTRRGEHADAAGDQYDLGGDERSKAATQEAINRADAALRNALDETKHVPHAQGVTPMEATLVKKPSDDLPLAPNADKAVDEDCSSSESGKTTGSSDTQKASNEKTRGDSTFGEKTAEDMIEMLRHDPEGLMEHLEGMSSTEQNVAMQHMQQRMQEINRMFSMMTNMAKAAHDTAKAAINNMRV